MFVFYLQEILHAKNIVIATGMRPRYPSEVGTRYRTGWSGLGPSDEIMWRGSDEAIKRGRTRWTKGTIVIIISNLLHYVPCLPWGKHLFILIQIEIV